MVPHTLAQAQPDEPEPVEVNEDFMETLSDKELEALRGPRSPQTPRQIDQAGGDASRPPPTQRPSAGAPGLQPPAINPTEHALDELGLTRELFAEDLAQGDQEVAPWMLGGVCLFTLIALGVLIGADVIRPGSFQRRGLREIDAHGPIMWFFAGFVTMFAGAVGVSIVAGQPWLTGGDPNSTRGIAALSLGQLAIGGGTALGLISLLRKGGAKKAGLGVGVMDPFWAATGAVLLAPIVLFTSISATMLDEALRHGAPEDFAHQSLHAIVESRGTNDFWLLLIGPVIAAPLLEEVVFRGFFQTAILRITGSAWASIVLVSIVFAAFHIPVLNGQWHALATLFVLSLGLGVAFERCKKLGVPILLHALFNLGMILLAVQSGLG